MLDCLLVQIHSRSPQQLHLELYRCWLQHRLALPLLAAASLGSTAVGCSIAWLYRCWLQHCLALPLLAAASLGSTAVGCSIAWLYRCWLQHRLALPLLVAALLGSTAVGCSIAWLYRCWLQHRLAMTVSRDGTHLVSLWLLQFQQVTFCVLTRGSWSFKAGLGSKFGARSSPWPTDNNLAIVIIKIVLVVHGIWLVPHILGDLTFNQFTGIPSS